MILDYFGDPESKNCGKCDRCDIDDGENSSSAVTDGLTESDANALLCGLRVILSGVTRMHGRFGKNLVAQMLCGSQNKRITQWKLQRLSTYGMLSAMKQAHLSKIIDAMIEHGMIEQREVDQRRPTIEISEFGKSVMHLKSPLPASFTLSQGLARGLAAAARPLESTDVAKAAAQSPAAQDDVSLDNAQIESQAGIHITLDDLTSPEKKLADEISEALKRWRRRASAALGIPAYRVLTNSTIDRLAEIRPQSSSELEVVSGIGPATMEQHGYDILEIIRGCLTATDDQGGATERSDATGPPGGQSDSGTADSGTAEPIAEEPPALLRTDSGAGDCVSAAPDPHDGVDASVGERDAYWTWRLFSDGFTMEEVCQIRKLNRRQIACHLQAAAARGRSVSPSWQS